ncbi:AI-2E family transporter [Pontibacter akesuensis]|nr:AI-2E family transporter [Pontibacter akesuensis]
MRHRGRTILTLFTILIVGLFFFFYGLVQAKAFLAPLAVAGLLAMVVLPVTRWLEKKGLKRGWASFCSTLLILSFFLLLAGLLSYQVKSFVQDWPQTEQKLESRVQNLQQFIEEKTGISVKQQNKNIANKIPGGSGGTSAQTNNQANQQQSGQSSQELFSGGQTSQSGGSSVLSTAGSFIMKFLSLMGTFLLTLVYIFFFLLYRSKFRKSVAKWFPEEKRPEVHNVISSAAHVSQNYLLGKLLLCVLIAVLYAIGLSLSGIKHAVLISVIAALLTLIPYIGNIIGFGLALAMALLSGAGSTALIGVILTFGITQLLETYTLEPYVVGGKVNLNPIMTIIVVVLGYQVWGVVGMLIAIPALGVAKIIFDHIPPLNPLGYLFGQKDTGSDDDSKLSKAKRWASDTFNS